MKHYLITIAVDANHVHAYVMTANRQDTAAVLLHMAEMIGQPVPPIALMTELSDGVDVVREMISRDSRGADGLRTADDFHYSVFVTSKGTDDDKHLMELH